MLLSSAQTPEAVAFLTELPHHAGRPVRELAGEMPFKQGVQAYLVVPKRPHRQLRGDPLALGYTFHTGPRSTREGEIRAWVAGIGRGWQVHVQEVRLENGDVAVFAHTEPEGFKLDHLSSAVLDEGSFPGSVEGGV